MMHYTPANVSSHHLSPTSPIFHHHHPFMIPLPPPRSPPPFTGGDRIAAADEFPIRDERFPQWGYQETRDLIEIRAQLEWEFTKAKGKKRFWEMVVNRMREKGYSRTIDQCKSKWKNLVNRYKGQEASDLDNGRQCPFFYELHALFIARDNRLHQAQVDSEIASIKGKKRLENASSYQSHEDYPEEQENEDEINVAQKQNADKGKRRKKGKSDKQTLENVNKNDCIFDGIQVMLRNFIQQQQRIDMQWKESMEKHAQEREVFEQEWQQRMEKLDREKMMMEQAWREREEQRRLREEIRTEKRDALLTMLLNKLIDEENL